MGAEFNCTLTQVEFSDDNYHIELKAELINEPKIFELLSDGSAEFIVVVDSKPFYRKVFKAAYGELKINIRIPYREVPSEFSFDLFPRIVTKKQIHYKNSNADEPISNYGFNLETKQKLAEHEKITVVFERAYRLFDSGPLIHISKLKRVKSPNTGQWTLLSTTTISSFIWLKKTMNYSET